jgi:SAM-dependent methyltransferase
MKNNPTGTAPHGNFPHPATEAVDSPTFWRNRWRSLKLAHCAVPSYGSSRHFWGSRKKIQAVYTRGDGNHEEKTRERMNNMGIPAGSRVLDIGAGPGTYAVPLALQGCSVTAVEPSPVMRDLLKTRMKKEKVKNITIIPARWEDVELAALGETFDAVIASFSLTMMDMGGALAKMHACCRGTVHLFWFLTPPAWAKVNEDLWPYLHGGCFPGEPTADWLWQILYEMGICAGIRPEPYAMVSRYRNLDEAMEEFRLRLNCTTPTQEETVRNYFQTVLKQDGDGFVLGPGTRSAHIWWKTEDQNNIR